MTPPHPLALATQPARRSGEREIDHAAAQRAAADLLRALGADVDSETLRDTPRRVAEAYAELLTPRPFRATTFPNEDGYDGLIVARAIPFHSLCMHHMLPFHGIARLARGRTRAHRRRRGAGGRAPLHVAARRTEARREDRHVGTSRRGARRCANSPGVPGLDHGDMP
jgi:GTP cyclohydrolase I